MGIRDCGLARVEAKELPELLRKMHAYEGSLYTRFALQLIALTFVRTSELIEAAVRGAEETAAALCAIPIADTVKRSDESGLVASTVDRRRLWERKGSGRSCCSRRFVVRPSPLLRAGPCERVSRFPALPDGRKAKGVHFFHTRWWNWTNRF